MLSFIRTAEDGYNIRCPGMKSILPNSKAATSSIRSIKSHARRYAAYTEIDCQLTACINSPASCNKHIEQSPGGRWLDLAGYSCSDHGVSACLQVIELELTEMLHQGGPSFSQGRPYIVKPCENEWGDRCWETKWTAGTFATFSLQVEDMVQVLHTKSLSCRLLSNP